MRNIHEYPQIPHYPIYYSPALCKNYSKVILILWEHLGVLSSNYCHILLKIHSIKKDWSTSAQMRARFNFVSFPPYRNRKTLDGTTIKNTVQLFRFSKISHLASLLWNISSHYFLACRPEHSQYHHLFWYFVTTTSKLLISLGPSQ